MKLRFAIPCFLLLLSAIPASADVVYTGVISSGPDQLSFSFTTGAIVTGTQTFTKVVSGSIGDTPILAVKIVNFSSEEPNGHPEILIFTTIGRFANAAFPAAGASFDTPIDSFGTFEGVGSGEAPFTLTISGTNDTPEPGSLLLICTGFTMLFAAPTASCRYRAPSCSESTGCSAHPPRMSRSARSW